tara:strand:+ start:974 stop:1165 length:192 start_codon:yes stop_codon:yes gene_type:complete
MMDRDPNGKLFIVKKITKFPDGTSRKRPVWERDGRIFNTLKAAKGEDALSLFYAASLGKGESI